MRESQPESARKNQKEFYTYILFQLPSAIHLTTLHITDVSFLASGVLTTAVDNVVRDRNEQCMVKGELIVFYIARFKTEIRSLAQIRKLESLEGLCSPLSL